MSIINIFPIENKNSEKFRWKFYFGLIVYEKYGSTGLQFSRGGGVTLSEIFLPKNQHSQRKLLNFENCCSGKMSKVPNLTFKVNFLCQKSLESFWLFFSLKNMNYTPCWGKMLPKKKMPKKTLQIQKI